MKFMNSHFLFILFQVILSFSISAQINNHKQMEIKFGNEICNCLTENKIPDSSDISKVTLKKCI